MPDSWFLLKIRTPAVPSWEVGELILLLEMIKYYLLKHTNMHKATYIDYFFFPPYSIFSGGWIQHSPASLISHCSCIQHWGRCPKRQLDTTDTATDGNGAERWEFLGKTLTFSVHFSSRPNFPVFPERRNFTFWGKSRDFLPSFPQWLFFFFFFVTEDTFSTDFWRIWNFRLVRIWTFGCGS